ncbi:unnamed protein product [Cyprideis torosa]|uniref:Uncharacterized protein n=1 Tax=Cyprideis torosa TaxID=163714 RepID=A0A7R8ZR24_9CRUS|nr:unnamed protein product [Cyprideis torosa]CAG0892014.1 unnamed protein product [Cyprideis torosa]
MSRQFGSTIAERACKSHVELGGVVMMAAALHTAGAARPATAGLKLSFETTSISDIEKNDNDGSYTYENWFAIRDYIPEAEKLQQHLSLLREEHIKLQNRLFDLENQLALATASMTGSSSPSSTEDSFPKKLLKVVADLHLSPRYRHTARRGSGGLPREDGVSGKKGCMPPPAPCPATDGTAALVSSREQLLSPPDFFCFSNTRLEGRTHIEELSSAPFAPASLALLAPAAVANDVSIVVSQSCSWPAHRFVLAARSSFWTIEDLQPELDWRDVPESVADVLLRWIYTSDISMDQDEEMLLGLITAANKFKVLDLVARCEDRLISLVSMASCIRFYTTADEIGTERLKNHCAKLISTHWDGFTAEDFQPMSARLLYGMIRERSQFPLHAAIQLKREDVVFLFLIERSQEKSITAGQLRRKAS